MIDAQTYLKQIRLYDTQINNKLEELQRIRALATKITTTFKGDVVSSSGNSDKIGDAVARIIDLEKEINEAVDKYIDAKKSISAVIDKIKDPYQVRVLHMRYFGVWDPAGETIYYPSWEEIAVEIHCTYRHTTRIHGFALQSVSELINGKKSGKKQKMS